MRTAGLRRIDGKTTIDKEEEARKTTREYHSQRKNKKVTGEILIIGGGPAEGSSDLARITRCKIMIESGFSRQYFQLGVAITFSSEDVIPDRDQEADTIAIKAVIENKMVHWIHIDLGSLAKVM